MTLDTRRWLTFLFGITLLAAALACSYAWPRDLDGRYAQSEHHEWVKSLHSPGGAWCCDISDGRALLDADWQSKGGHYQVKLRDDWLDVPDDAVIGEPNKLGQTIVWMQYKNGEPVVVCFLPGAGG
jgi:hypothetical protein